MTTVRSVMDKAARTCSIQPPLTWIGVTDLSHQQLIDYLDNTIDEMRKRVDWEDPISSTTQIVGNGGEEYDLPANFSRIARDDLAVYERTTTRRRGLPITSNGKWTALKSVGTAGAYRYYRITGYPGAHKILFFRPLAAADEIDLAYLTDFWTASPTGTLQSSFVTNDDLLLYDPRTVELGVTWRFLRQKGLAYDDYLAEYESYLVREANDDRNFRKFQFGPTGEQFRAPWDVPIPDFIPPSS